MTGARNGIVSLWKNKIDKSTKLFDKWTLVLFKDGCIFAVAENKDAVELNIKLDVVKIYKCRNTQPLTIDANKNYLVVGYDSASSGYVSYVDVHNRNQLDQDRTHQKRMVSKFLYSIQISRLP